MTNPKQNKDALGKGIRSLLQNIDSDLKNAAGNLKQEVAQTVTAILRIPIEQIEPNPRQPRHDFDEMVFDTIIHRNARISEAPSVGKPVILYDGQSKGAVNYLNLAKEILQKNDMTKIKQEERILE